MAVWETLHGVDGTETRVKRAFGWVVTFRDFPVGAWQTVQGSHMMTEALTYFTKGRAEFFLDGVQRNDRVPGTLSSEHEVVGQTGVFELRYVEPTTRVCIPAFVNRGQLPSVTQLRMLKGEILRVHNPTKMLVCLGKVSVNGKMFDEESSFMVSDGGTIEAFTEEALLLDFSKTPSPRLK